MTKFKLISDYKPIPDQENAIKALIKGHINGVDQQVLLGVTGSGKTFTIANVIERLQKPALIISHNKTLASQLYQEFREFFPENAVSFFVSYYDYYQPEAYIPATDTYIEKDADINELIDKLRLAATTNLLTRRDTIVIASVSCIYNIGSPKDYGSFIFEFAREQKVEREQIIDRLIDLQYERGEFGFHRGTFRIRGNIIDIYPAYQDDAIRLELESNFISSITIFNPVTGEAKSTNSSVDNFVLYPSKHFIADPVKNENVFGKIKKDMQAQVDKLESIGKSLEAHRLKQKVTYDLEMIKEIGYVKGIENYSRYFDGRNPGDPPFSLLDYFNDPYAKDWLVFIDESHMTFPQIRGMYNGDLSRKQTLIDYGFRLPAALDNRPLRFEEFLRRIPNFIATSATPSQWEINMAKESAGRITKNIKTNDEYGILNIEYRNGKKKDKLKQSTEIYSGIVEQLLRPTGIPDPEVSIRPVSTQVKDVIEQIKKHVIKKQRTLVTTLTKKTAEDLATYMNEKGIKVHYLHSDIQTLERSNILDDLRKGNFDCLIGVNLLREGLDLPEVALVAILDADKEGFLRSEVSLIQTMGRAARHVEGKVILYADKITGSIERALEEVKRRRQYQIKINKKYGIVPRSIEKPIREKIVEAEQETEIQKLFDDKYTSYKTLPDIDIAGLTPLDRRKLAKKLRSEMKIAAQDLNFELAIEIRDKLKNLEN